MERNPAGCREGCALGMAHLNHLTSEGVTITQILTPVHDSLPDLLPCQHSCSLAWSMDCCPCPWVYGSPQAHPLVGAAPLHHLLICGQSWEFCSPSGPLQAGKQHISTDRKLRAPAGTTLRSTGSSPPHSPNPSVPANTPWWFWGSFSGSQDLIRGD